MYIQNMTMEEMVREYRADLPEIEKNNNRIDCSEYAGKLLYKARKTGRCSFIRYYKTQRGNRYINVFQYVKSSISTRNNPRWDWSVHSIALMQTYKGLSAIAFFSEANLAIVFQQHFFVRYKQRLLNVCDWKTKNELLKTKTIEDVIAVWIKRNPDIVWINTKSQFNNREHIFAPINDGTVLMQWDGQHIQANTFITEDMYSKKQVEMVGRAEDAKQEQKEMETFLDILKDIKNQESKIQIIKNQNYAEERICKESC